MIKTLYRPKRPYITVQIKENVVFFREILIESTKFRVIFANKIQKRSFFSQKGELLELKYCQCSYLMNNLWRRRTSASPSTRQSAKLNTKLRKFKNKLVFDSFKMIGQFYYYINHTSIKFKHFISVINLVTLFHTRLRSVI